MLVRARDYESLPESKKHFDRGGANRFAQEPAESSLCADRSGGGGFARRSCLSLQHDPHVARRFVDPAASFLELHSDPEFSGWRDVQGGTNGSLVPLDNLLCSVQFRKDAVAVDQVL